MRLLTILTMASVLTVVWGGFLVALVTALRRERRKSMGQEAPGNEGEKA